MATKKPRPDDEPVQTDESGSTDDTEGHFLPNIVISRQLAAQRERDIQRNLQRHEQEVEARRPHRKESHR
ncbi:MAG: hypothetical protein ACXWMU_04460 [Candidatus Limnocylindrales bacterium]